MSPEAFTSVVLIKEAGASAMPEGILLEGTGEEIIPAQPEQITEAEIDTAMENLDEELKTLLTPEAEADLELVCAKRKFGRWDRDGFRW
jgi:hypothetical protein